MHACFHTGVHTHGYLTCHVILNLRQCGNVCRVLKGATLQDRKPSLAHAALLFGTNKHPRLAAALEACHEGRDNMTAAVVAKKISGLLPSLALSFLDAFGRNVRKGGATGGIFTTKPPDMGPAVSTSGTSNGSYLRNPFEGLEGARDVVNQFLGDDGATSYVDRATSTRRGGGASAAGEFGAELHHDAVWARSAIGSHGLELVHAAKNAFSIAASLDQRYSAAFFAQPQESNPLFYAYLKCGGESEDFSTSVDAASIRGWTRAGNTAGARTIPPPGRGCVRNAIVSLISLIMYDPMLLLEEHSAAAMEYLDKVANLVTMAAAPEAVAHAATLAWRPCEWLDPDVLLTREEFMAAFEAQRNKGAGRVLHQFCQDNKIRGHSSLRIGPLAEHVWSQIDPRATHAPVPRLPSATGGGHLAPPGPHTGAHHGGPARPARTMAPTLPSAHADEEAMSGGNHSDPSPSTTLSDHSSDSGTSDDAVSAATSPQPAARLQGTLGAVSGAAAQYHGAHLSRVYWVKRKSGRKVIRAKKSYTGTVTSDAEQTAQSGVHTYYVQWSDETSEYATDADISVWINVEKSATLI